MKSPMWPDADQRQYAIDDDKYDKSYQLSDAEFDDHQQK